MPSTPTTKSQVQAYQFVLRRMQSALVRRDAVMLHDPMRTHTRATIVGFVLAALGVLGFVIFGLISPAPTAPKSGIVIAKPSGAIYVKTENPSMLIPTFNLASARLLLMAQQQNGQQGGAQSGGAQQEVKQPDVVPDEQLKDIPRGRLTGIIDGPQLLPSKDQRVSDNWSVCDNTKIDPTLPSQEGLRQAKTETTVFAGVASPGREISTKEAILVNADDGRTYLIYRLQSNPNLPNANTVRAEVDKTKTSVWSALKLSSAQPRHISMGMLNAIPPVGVLTPPTIPGAGEKSQYDLDSLPVGQVFRTTRSDGTVDTYAILRNGIQQVTPAVADMIRFERNASPGPIADLSPDKVSRANIVPASDPSALQVGTFPQDVPTVLEPARSPVACLGWNIVDAGTPNEDGHTAVFVNSQLPDTKGVAPIDIGQSSPDGVQIDKFYMQPGFAAVVRSATSKASFTTGPISLISDRGLRYGVPDVATANALGLDNPRPAPEAIIKLLPTGALLNTTDVRRSYDSVPIDPKAGTFPSQAPQAAGSAPPGK
ncbi:type VII secretion protein EccB [Amycolatopsis anabasis]|uniref:type VII secretion protein EccB n=1 Tax=Amycolatopsis anabasis TaxID=1840409 RepID=UPI00131E4B28|nr:type VII secretion protein EccB [Amycolatopsis anabasis]